MILTLLTEGVREYTKQHQIRIDFIKKIKMSAC